MTIATKRTVDKGPRRHPITVGEYLRMAEVGILDRDSRFELVKGEIFDMPPIGPAHASKLNRLVELLSAALRGHAITHISEGSESTGPDTLSGIC
jgi:Uma2 family endonuclease